ncbi:MAG: tetratricopeptide repeat protein [Microscillaceae bacterium]|nr:tetratricopeptide repeat protein [Microscillaceae bacterium]
MRPSQIILLFVAVFIIAALTQLPKALVDNQEKTPQKPAPEAQTPTKHARQMPPALRLPIDALKKQWENEEIIAKKTIFADSIAKLYKKANFYDSTAFFRDWIASQDPEQEQAWLAAGDAYYEAFNFYGIIDETQARLFAEKARQYFDKILKVRPNDLDIQAKKAVTLVLSENPMQGIQQLRGILEKNPDNELALLNLGLFAMQSNQFDKAAERFEKLISVNPQQGEAKILLGQSYERLGQKDKAIRILQEVLQTEKDSLLRAAASDLLQQLNGLTKK